MVVSKKGMFYRFKECAHELGDDSFRLEMTAFLFCQKRSLNRDGLFDGDTYDQCISECVSEGVCKPFSNRFGFLIDHHVMLMETTPVYSYSTSKETHETIMDIEDCIEYNLSTSQENIGIVTLIFLVIIFGWFIGLLKN